MAVFASDAFTDTNGVALQSHTPTGGGSWTEHASYTAGAMEIRTNRARQSGGINNSLFYHSGTPSSAEYDVEADLALLSNNSGIYEVAGRIATAANTYYAARKRLNGTVALIKVVAGTVTSLGSASGQSDVGGNLRLQIRDATKKLFWDDVEILSSTDNEITAAGKAGIVDRGSNSGNTTGMHFDNFLADDVSAGGATLVVQDAAHAHAADGPALTQANTLAVADATHGHAVDAPSLTQANILAANDAAHAHTAESPSLTQANTLAVADALHAHSSESPALVQANTLAVQDAAHGHTAESPTLSLAAALTVADATHAHAADSPSLVQANTLAVADAAHGHTAESPTVDLTLTLAIADAHHTHTADSAVLTQAHVLSVADAAHAHAAESPTLEQANVLAVADASHAHAADNVTLFSGDIPPSFIATPIGRFLTAETPVRLLAADAPSRSLTSTPQRRQ